jgi:hypothetical protein
MKRHLVVFDIDGCIADDSARRSAMQRPPESDAEWDVYHVGSRCDEVINAKHVEGWIDYPDPVAVAFVTARPEKFRTTTVEWLKNNFDLHSAEPQSWYLIMRAEGDKRGSVELKLDALRDLQQEFEIVAAYDDRADVVGAYRDAGIVAWRMDLQGVWDERPIKTQNRTPEILRCMASTFEERNAVYEDNYKLVPKLAKVLFPDGLPPEILHSEQWHLFELKLVKLTRFAKSGLTHVDSIHDDAVYSALIESIITKNQKDSE